jgi:NAD-dependent deacetylase
VLRRATDAAATGTVFIAVGTSAVVYPAAGLVRHARRSGATVIEINPEATGASDVADIAIRRPAHEALPEIDVLL